MDSSMIPDNASVDDNDLKYNTQSILAAIVNSSDDAIISKTLKGIITSWNPAATKLFGYTEKEAIGKHISIIIPPERIHEEDMIIGKISKGEKIDHFETIRVAKDGTERYISLTISPVRNRHGEIIGASKLAKDIGLRIFAEEKTAALAAIVASSDDAIISKTLNGIITSWNAAATRMFGFSEKEAIGNHITLIIPSDRLDEETMIIENIRAGNKVDHFETIRMSKDGSEKHISLTVSPIKDNKGRIIGASKIARDISFRVQAEKQRDLYIKRLQELNDYKDEFMVMASHELKTPLTVILANLQVLEHLLEESEYLPQLKKIISKSYKMSDLISNLLDVSKIQSGKLELNFTQFDLKDLITQVTKNLQVTTSDHTIEFCASGDSFLINADEDRIEQVLTNLIANAIKYSPDGGKIIVKLLSGEKEATVEVSDEGIGIPHEDLEFVFERFFRSRGKAKSFSGSGIGLYISSEIIRNHHGKIWAESIEDEGATFYFTLPGKV